MCPCQAPFATIRRLLLYSWPRAAPLIRKCPQAILGSLAVVVLASWRETRRTRHVQGEGRRDRLAREHRGRHSPRDMDRPNGRQGHSHQVRDRLAERSKRPDARRHGQSTTTCSKTTSCRSSDRLRSRLSRHPKSGRGITSSLDSTRRRPMTRTGCCAR